MSEIAAYERQVKHFFSSLSSIKFKKARCILCDSSRYVVLFTKVTMEVVRCECGFIFNRNQPTDSALDEFYEESQALKTWSKIKETNVECIRQHKKFSPAVQYLTGERINSLMDIGCGNGKFLGLMRKSRPLARLQGNDPNEEAVKICKQKQLKVNLSCIEQFTESNNKMFDAITLWGVLEHLKRPVHQIIRLSSHIKKNGILLFAVPNADSRVVRQLWRECFTFCPQHLWYFDWRSIKAFMKKVGFAPSFSYSIEPEAEPVLRSSFGLPPYDKLPQWAREKYLQHEFVARFGRIILQENSGYKLVIAGRKL